MPKAMNCISGSRNQVVMILRIGLMYSHVDHAAGPQGPTA
jgi:hypothetical protein